jgi:hypothetical protein
MRALVVSDQTGLEPRVLFNAVWSLNYQAFYHYNRSPWVEHGYCEPCAGVHVLPTGVPAPTDAWSIELLATSDQEGALGYHEDFGAKTSSPHSTRGLDANETPLAKVFLQTSEEAGVAWTEVASHEMLEMLVDPYVVDESRLRKYLNTAAKEWYVAEVGDPVQEQGYDVGFPEGHTTNVVVSNFAYPGWWAQEQRRLATSFCSDKESWHGAPPDSNLAPFALAPGGYMSVAPEAEPENWSQIFGARHAADRTQA